MISDAKVTVTCDADCGVWDEIELPYLYDNYSGTSGHYDSSDATIRRLLEKRGWTIEGEKHFCEGCYAKERE